MKWVAILSLYHMCVIKCWAMTSSELEDFTNFLRETSQLDQSVKSNIPNDYDDDAPISDHAWEESGKFEGDLILNERQRRMIVASVAEGLARNGISDTTKRWPNNEVIYYIQTEHFSSDQLQGIQNGIEDLARASCVKFTPYKKGDRDAVVIQGSRRGCFSQVGYQGGYQILNLSSRHPAGRGCFRHGTVVHEMLHTLGFYHMQSSSDRDDYIDVMWPNIVKNARHNFRKYNSFSVSDFGVGYDYDSVLHYSRKAFSLNGKDTLVPKQLGATIGQRIGLSDKDAEKLNKMYCDAESDLPADSNDAIQKVSKKKDKNKPFEGQGLGYQQGKTVIIKLPKAGVYRAQDLPQFTMFNYFSKARQGPHSALVQGSRARKEMIINGYETPEMHVIKEYVPLSAAQLPHLLDNNRQNLASSYSEKENPMETLADDIDSDLHEAFYRLSNLKEPYHHAHTYHLQKDDHIRNQRLKDTIENEENPRTSYEYIKDKNYFLGPNSFYDEDTAMNKKWSDTGEFSILKFGR